MAEKHKEKINPDAIRELISQGIPMRRKEDSPLLLAGKRSLSKKLRRKRENSLRR